MADSKGSSSNPTQGLVSHLDRNRDLQQDRTVASSSTPASVSIPSIFCGTEKDPQLTALHQSFRSSRRNASAASAEANFSNFNTTATQFGALPLRPSHQQHPPFRPELGRTWLREFSSLGDRQVPDSRTMATSMRAGAEGALNQDASGHMNASQVAAAANSSSAHHNNGFLQRQVIQQPIMFPSAPVFQSEDAQLIARIDQSQGMYQCRMQQPANVVPAPEKYNIYPEQVLADNPGEAMEAAFAAYDQNFQDEMDNWIDAHGPEDRVDHVQIMEEMIAVDNVRDALHGNVVRQTEKGPSLNMNVPDSNLATYQEEGKKQPTGDHSKDEGEKVSPTQNGLPEDGEMKKHAVQILGSLDTEGSAATKEKLNASSFVKLMKAIATGKAVLQGETFVDPATGQVLEEWDALSNGSNIITDNNTTADKGKGKGKMEEHESEGGSYASA
ncbi:unnamed protein product [Discula destructiva]